MNGIAACPISQRNVLIARDGTGTSPKMSAKGVIRVKLTMFDNLKKAVDEVKRVCKNCGQWKREYPKGSGQWDCMNDCTKRGFEPK